ncbi:MAG: tetratricopeptide repeat protein, partial [Candidatus Heimdallarchaeota archaeon]
LLLFFSDYLEGNSCLNEFTQILIKKLNSAIFSFSGVFTASRVIVMRLKPPENTLNSWSLPHRMFYHFVTLILPRFLQLYFRFEVRNLDYLDRFPEETPTIFCFNHQSHLDTFMLPNSYQKLIKKEIFTFFTIADHIPFHYQLLFEESELANKEDEKLNQAKQLMIKGELSKALELVNHLEKHNSLQATQKLRCQLIKSNLFKGLGDFRNALSLAEEVFQESQQLVEPLISCDALIIKLEISVSFFRIKEASNLIKRVENLFSLLKHIEKGELDRRRAILLTTKAFISMLKANWDQSQEYAQQSLALRRKLGDKVAIADSFQLFGLIFESKGDWDQALNYHQQSLDLREELDNKQTIATSLNNVGRMYVGKDNNKALEYCERSLSIHKDFGNKLLIIETLETIGWINRLKGELSLALDSSQQIMSLSEEIGLKFEYIQHPFHMGLILGLRGEIDQALEYMEESMTERINYMEEEGMAQNYATAWRLNRLGKLYREKEDYGKAINRFNESISICEPRGDEFAFVLVKSESVFYLLAIALDQNLLDKARKYLDQLERINYLEVSSYDSLINQRYRVAQALILKTSPRIKDKARAQDILQQFIDEECSDHDLTVAALLILCDLLLVELRMSNALEVLDEVKTINSRLLSIAKKQHSFWLLAETYVLKARLSLFELDLNNSTQLLNQALLIAEENGLKKLAVKIYSEQTQLQDQMTQWQQLIERDAPLSERLDLAQLESMILRMARRKLEITEAETIEYAKRAQQLAKAWNKG